MGDQELAERLLTQSVEDAGTQPDAVKDVPNKHFVRTTRLLYISHFLSTWNSRAFEFGAFLFLATIYPQTLLPASVYALSRAGAAALLSPWLGHYVDHGERLNVARVSIVSQRIAVAISCILLFLMTRLDHLRLDPIISALMLACLCVLAVGEKLGAILNTIAIERDWAVVIAGGEESRLMMLNSQMRRIDLFCKLVAPLAVSFLDAASSEVAILVTGGITLASVGIEYFAIARVHAAVPELRTERSIRPGSPAERRPIFEVVRSAFSSTAIYVRHPAFLPSFALALLYLTVLSFSGQMVTYLLALGMTPSVIGVLRGVSALFEMSATVLAPKIMDYIGPVRAGIWFLNWQLFWIGVATLFFWAQQNFLVTALGTISAVIASRIGLWGFDLCAQIIVQEEVEVDLRGTFSSQEIAFQNIFEMLSFASTIIFAQPDRFKYPATISAAAVGVAGVLYAAFVRTRRGHLVHFSKCIDRHHRTKHSWSRVVKNDGADEHELAEHGMA